MKARKAIALMMILAGVFLLAVSVVSMAATVWMLNWLVPLAIGVVLCVAGLVLLIMELLETWLSRGQRALVDGLQAG